MPQQSSGLVKWISRGAASTALLLLLVSCKPGPQYEVKAYQDGGGTIRCSIGQSAIGEQQDVQNGQLPAYGHTFAKRDLYCGNDDNLHPGWDGLDVRVWLMTDTNTCAVGTTLGTLSNRDVGYTLWGDCGADQYYAMSLNGAFKPGEGVPYRQYSFTDTVYVNP